MEANKRTWDLFKMRHRGRCKGGAGNLESLIPGLCLCLAREDFFLDAGCMLNHSQVPVVPIILSVIGI